MWFGVYPCVLVRVGKRQWDKHPLGRVRRAPLQHCHGASPTRCHHDRGQTVKSPPCPNHMLGACPPFRWQVIVEVLGTPLPSEMKSARTSARQAIEALGRKEKVGPRDAPINHLDHMPLPSSRPSLIMAALGMPQSTS